MQLQVPARGWFWSETAPMSGHPIAFLFFLGEDLGLPATAVHCRHTYAMGINGISPLRARPPAPGMVFLPLARLGCWRSAARCACGVG